MIRPIPALPDWLVNRVALPLRRRLRGDVYASPERLRASLEKGEPADPSPPERLRRDLQIQRTTRQGWPAYTVTPRKLRTERSVTYLHGGAYVGEIARWHWLLVRKLALDVPARILVPIYPLAPRATAAEVVPATAQLIAEQARTGPAVVMGDSSGGGLALAAAMRMRDAGLPQPERLVLISPFLDGRLGDPRQNDALARKDKMLRAPGLREAARLYAGPLEVSDPMVSPINGELRGLPPITIFTGTHDLLDPDARRLAERAEGAGVRVDLHAVDGAPHAFPLLPTRQGGRARRLLVQACRAAST